MRASRRAAAALAAVALSTGAARAESAWQPVVAKDGVRVEQRLAPDRILPELRATVEIDAGLFEVLAVIRDVPRQTEWMANCVESRRLREEGAAISILYNRTDAPWPVHDRDVVLRAETVLLEPEARAQVRFANVADPAAPPIDGFVRMPRLVGDYDLAALGPERTRVTYRLDIDPGGALPAWAVTRTTRDTPLYTLLGLRRQVGATRGAYADSISTWRLLR